MKKKYKVCGFDISSTTIGLSILSVDGEKITLDYSDYYKPTKDGNIIERLFETKKFILNFLKEKKPDYVAIEDILKFMKGGSSANTIILLAQFNRMIGLTALEKTKKVPQLIGVQTVRRLIRPEGWSGKVKKEDIPDLLMNHYKFDFTVKHNTKGNIAAETYDMADAVAVALAYIVGVNKNEFK